ADHYLYREACKSIPFSRFALLAGREEELRLLGAVSKDLRGMDLRGMDLRGTDLRSTFLRGALFGETKMSLEALMQYSDPFTDEMLAGIVFHGFKGDLHNRNVRDILFNHRNNAVSGSILTAVDGRLRGNERINC
ncbi:pentapeptide repeat-containing protein, partial [Paraburkholderia sp. RL17-373-BIF-A]|uniref:pentapeptide repeat-containing protein n=1 Tax=Paraburkholderia sp. RL17-373-BIF-A TaxID=3031629 RepID=UPI0038BAC151